MFEQLLDDGVVVLRGWSQGVQVIGDVLDRCGARLAGRDDPDLSPYAAARIAAVALFGNPRFTADQPYNAGTTQVGVSGTNPRELGALAGYTARLGDYCEATDIACQNMPGSNVVGRVSYTSGLRRAAADFVLTRLASTGVEVQATVRGRPVQAT